MPKTYIGKHFLNPSEFWVVLNIPIGTIVVHNIKNRLYYLLTSALVVPNISRDGLRKICQQCRLIISESSPQPNKYLSNGTQAQRSISLGNPDFGERFSILFWQLQSWFGPFNKLIIAIISKKYMPYIIYYLLFCLSSSQFIYLTNGRFPILAKNGHQLGRYWASTYICRLSEVAPESVYIISITRSGINRNYPFPCQFLGYIRKVKIILAFSKEQRRYLIPLIRI